MPDKQTAPWIDYSHEVRLVHSPLVRALLIGCSGFFLILGFIGLFLPLLPTTPFVLLAAACYARSSVRFYNWLMNHRWFGEALRRWVEFRCISRKNKIYAICLLWITLLPTIVWVIPVFAVKILLGLIGASVTFFLLTRPSEPRSS